MYIYIEREREMYIYIYMYTERERERDNTPGNQITQLNQTRSGCWAIRGGPKCDVQGNRSVRPASSCKRKCHHLEEHPYHWIGIIADVVNIRY